VDNSVAKFSPIVFLFSVGSLISLSDRSDSFRMVGVPNKARSP
jgi:hypothetical protein